MSVAAAKPSETMASTICTTRKLTPWVWSVSMLRTRTAQTQIAHALESRNVQIARLVMKTDYGLVAKR